MEETIGQAAHPPNRSRPVISFILRLIVSLAVPVLTGIALWWSFTFMRDADANKFLVAIVALIVGVGAVWAIYLITDNLVSLLPSAIRENVRPFVFVGPALVILLVYLIYPAFLTVINSFRNANSTIFVGLQNYLFVLTDPDMLIVLRNNIMWLIVVTSFVVGLGLIVAVMVDRVRWESTAKAIIFLPMAISAVGASVIWKFVYSFQPLPRPQIGLLNAILVALGGEPQGWLILEPWNNFFMMNIRKKLFQGSS